MNQKVKNKRNCKHQTSRKIISLAIISNSKEAMYMITGTEKWFIKEELKNNEPIEIPQFELL